jgi:hypothetical protein
MYSRTFSTTVCLFWLVAMIWLVSQKVLPSLRTGPPPNYNAILAAQKQNPVVGWRLEFNKRELGWALSETKPQENGMTEIESRVHFNELPLAEMTSIMARMFNRLVENSHPKLAFDARSSLLIDPLGKLVRLDSTLRVNGFPDPVRIQGVVEGSQMLVSIDFRDFSTKKEIYLPENAIVGDALSPQSQLPNLCEGQTWTAPSFSPFRSASAPMEIQIAEVEGRELITWNDQIIDSWLVVYRNDPGRGFRNSQSAKDKLWVSDDGRVLKQQSNIFDSTLTVTRMTDEESRKLAEEMAHAEMNDE